MSVSRLFETLYYLVEHKQTTAKELADYFEVSIRTIYRDLDRLLAAGFPINTVQGNNGGISIDKNFVVEKAAFNPKEQEQILMAIQTIEHLQGANENSLVTKLTALFNQEQRDWIEIDFGTWHQDNKLNHKFDLLKEAIFNDQIVEFNYINSYGESSKRKVLPNKLFFKSNTWYLQGYCLTKTDYRIFRLTRINDIVLTIDKFNQTIKLPPPITTYDNHIMMKKIKLKFNKSLGSVVFDEFNTDEVLIDQAGNYIVETNVSDNYWLISFILSFGSQIEIIKPIELKEKLLDEIDKIKKIYK